MKQIIFIMILVFGFEFSDLGQNEISPCPIIDVSGGSGGVKPGEPISFTVNVSEDANNLNLEYIWTISRGTIVSGQESKTITVDKTDFPNFGLTATVEIKGLPENCQNTFSESMTYDPIPSAVLLDEFGYLSNNKVKARIEAIYTKLKDESNSQAYIINYGTDKDIAARENQIRKALIFCKLDATRTTLVRGGANPDGVIWTKIYNVPPGANNPQP